MSNYRELKEECYEANMALPQFGLADLTFGNASVIDRTRGVFGIKPSGVDYPKLRPEDIVVIDLDGKQVEGKLRASSDTATHRRLLQAFTGAGAVVHTHSRNAVSFAQAGRGIPCLGTTHADYFYGEVPVTRPMTPEEIKSAYEWETGNVIVERFKALDPMQIPAVLVHGHGPFAWGPTSAKAVENAFVLEVVAEMALKALQINPQVQPLAQSLVDKHFLRKHGTSAYYGQEVAGSVSGS
jgi:L-ribulose-5-phosphate 4-epimerase